MPADRRHPRSWGAFTLLETLIVLALLGLVAALVAPAALRMSLGDARDRDVLELTEALAAARLDALRAGEARVTEIVRTNEGLSATWPGRTVRWDAWPLTLAGADARPIDALRVRFAATGRADQQEFAFMDAQSGRMWRIEFDPVSGAPSWRRAEDGAD